MMGEGAYRDGVLRCPACGEPMRPEATSGGTIDLCDACGGAWIDWFDGDLRAIAEEAERGRRDTPLPPQAPVPRGCPRCARALEAELLRFEDALDEELVTGVEVFRCADCIGAFVPRASAHLLIDRQTEGRPMTVWEAVLTALQRFFGSPRREPR
jgi:Zn-finger nucleic acid-binding protein